MCCGVSGSGGTITGWPKPPFFHAFPHPATLFHIVGELPSNRVYERIFFKRLFAVFWRKNAILGFILKPCAGIRNFVQPGITISPKRGNPGPYLAPFGSGYLQSVMLITASNTTSNLIRSGVHFAPNPGTNYPLIPKFSQSGLCTGSVQGIARPCLIINSWIIQLNRGLEERLTILNPGVIRADPRTTLFLSIISRRNISGSDGRQYILQTF